MQHVIELSLRRKSHVSPVNERSMQEKLKRSVRRFLEPRPVEHASAGHCAASSASRAFPCCLSATVDDDRIDPSVPGCSNGVPPIVCGASTLASLLSPSLEDRLPLLFQSNVQESYSLGLQRVLTRVSLNCGPT